VTAPARQQSITAAKIVPEGYEADQIHSLIIASRDRKASPWICSASPRFLYEDEAKTGPFP